MNRDTGYVWENVPSLNRESMQRALARAKEPMEHAVPVRTFSAGEEAFGCPALLTVTEPGAEPTRGGTISRTEGLAHAKRRPLISRVTTRQAKLWLEGGKLREVANRVLVEAMSAASPSGLTVDLDLVAVSKRIFTELAANLAGLRGFEAKERYELLSEIREDFGEVVALRFVKDDLERERVLNRSSSALRTFETEFFEPALEWHLEQLKEVDEGRLESAKLPPTLMMLIASKADDYYLDRGNALRETIGIMNAASDTAAAALVNAYAELQQWFEKHPEDWELRYDSHFLFAAATENLRLHSAFPVFARRAAQPVTLRDGTNLSPGDRVGIMMHEAGRDPDVFGADAEEFNPHRTLDANVPPYGLGFGAGQHMCVGRGFVIGWHGVDGAVVQLLRWLYSMDARPAPHQKAQYCADFDLDKWDFYPLTLACPHIEAR